MNVHTASRSLKLVLHLPVGTRLRRGERLPDTALTALEDAADGNDVAAVESLGAFVNHVEAQAGNKITEEDAELLIEGES